MMRISDEQIAAMAEPMDRHYERELVRDFQRQHPQRAAALGEDALNGIVVQSLARARAAGVGSSAALLRYVSLAVLVHPEFDLEPDVRALLDTPGMDADYKVHLLSDILIANLGAR